MAEWRSRRSAKARLKPAGMCWVRTMAGASAGICSSTTRRASVPPVEAPMAIRRSVVRKRSAGGAGSVVSSPVRGALVRASGRTRALAAALTLAMISSA